MLKFLNKYQNQKPNLYHDSLHIALYNHPNGLSSEEIAQYLRISNGECQKLLKAEQILDYVNVDISSGDLIFTTKITEHPSFSLEESLKIVKQKKLFSNMKLGFTLLSGSLFSFTLISVTLNISIKPGNIKDEIVNQNSLGILNILEQDNDMQNFLDKQLRKRKLTKKQQEIDDLNKRIENMRTQVIQLNCRRKHWENGDTCYVEGRLLSENEFEKEIDKMKGQINEIRNTY